MDLSFATSPQEGSSREVPFHVLQTEAKCMGIKLWGGGMGEGGGSKILSVGSNVTSCLNSEFYFETWRTHVKILVTRNMTSTKVKIFPIHGIKHTGGIRGIAPLILNLGTRWR